MPVKIGDKRPLTGAYKGITGRVTYIHPAGRWYMAEAILPPYRAYNKPITVRECFHVVEGCFYE